MKIVVDGTGFGETKYTFCSLRVREIYEYIYIYI